MGEVIHLPHKQRPQARIEVVDTAAGEFVVGIQYSNGDYILAGAFFHYAEALDHARTKARALGIRVVDFVGSGGDDPGDAA